MPRTGGTLFVTMLDAHPLLAMSYEIYQDRLLDERERPFKIEEAISVIYKHRSDDESQWIKNIEYKNLKTFAARAKRADISIVDLLREMELFYSSGGDFSSLDNRFGFIRQLMILKMEKTKKAFWGGKINIDLEMLLKKHPDAYFFTMLRDGRDVLASQKNVGNFITNPIKCASDWRNHIHYFIDFKEKTNRARFIKYEDLVLEPGYELQKVCRFIGIDYHHSMVNYHLEELSLFANPHGHLSYKQLKKGLNANSIGRWKNDLSLEEVEQFESVNSDLLSEYGYM